MNSNPLESQVCVTQFWKHDKEDSDFDHDLLGLLQPKKSISRKARAESKIGPKSQDTNVNSPNFTKLDTLGIQKVQTETKEHSERKMTAQKLRRNLSQPSRNNITNFEEIGNQSPNPSQPKFNPDYGQITQRNCTPVIYPSQQEGSKKILLIKKPSFNVGLAKITDDQIAPQHKNHMKVSALLESRRHTPSQHSSLQSLENINARTRSHNQMLIPIQKLAESGSLNLPEETTPNRYPHSPFKSHPDSKTPLRDREIISKSPDDIDYMGFSKQQKDWVKSSRSLSKEKPGLITPSIPVNIWTAEGNGDGLRSLIRLPKLTKKTLGDNSPFFEAVEERSTSRKASRDNITGLILEKKLIALSPDRAFNGSPIFQKTTSTS